MAHIPFRSSLVPRPPPIFFLFFSLLLVKCTKQSSGKQQGRSRNTYHMTWMQGGREVDMGGVPITTNTSRSYHLSRVLLISWTSGISPVMEGSRMKTSIYVIWMWTPHPLRPPCVHLMPFIFGHSSPLFGHSSASVYYTECKLQHFTQDFHSHALHQCTTKWEAVSQ